MYLLDTDHLTILERGGPDASAVRSNLTGRPPEDIATTIVSYEEQTRSWMSYLARSTSIDAQVLAYRRLRQHLRTFCAIPIVEFDRGAAQECERLRRLHPRLGAMDLRIAAIALANGATVVTRNAADFGRVAGLHVEDWTK